MKKSPALLVVAFTIAASMSGDAIAISYLGKRRGADRAVIEDDDNGPREVRKGDVVPELGEIRTIDENEMVFERVLTDEERDKLKAEGLLAPDVRRFHLYRRPEPELSE